MKQQISDYFAKPQVNPLSMIKRCVHCGEELIPLAWNLNFVDLAYLQSQGERYYKSGLADLERLGYKAKWQYVGLHEWDGQKHGNNIIWRLPSCTCEGAQDTKLTPDERKKKYNGLRRESKLPREVLNIVNPLTDIIEVDANGDDKITTFDHQIAAANCSNALRLIDLAHNYIRQIKRSGKNLLWICGDRGMGKTLLAVLTTHAIMKKQLWDTLYVEWVGTSAIFNKTTVDSSDYLRKIKNVTLLCIDDLERAQITKNGVEKLYDIINHRYQKRMPTIFTSNMSPEQLLKYYKSFNGFNQADNTYINQTGEVTVDRLADVNWNFATLEWRGTSLRGVVR